MGHVGKNLPSLRFTALTSCRGAKDRPTPSYITMKLVFLLSSPAKSVGAFPTLRKLLFKSLQYFTVFEPWRLSSVWTLPYVWTMLCPPGSGILLAREEVTSRGHFQFGAGRQNMVNCLLWFFLKSIILWGLTLPDI